MKKCYLLLVTLISFLGAKSQVTYPAPYSLATANYFFNYWSLNNNAGTYPANMRFYRLGNQNDPLLADTIYQDYADAYNQTSGTRINALNFGGFSFLNTGGGTPTPYRLGAAILALNTTGRQDVQVTWTGKTVTPNFREYEIRLFYRVGSSGVWIPVLNTTNDTVRYVRSAIAGDSLVIGPVTLPSAANNQALVQVCWKYFQTYSNTGTNQRAELSINNLSVTSNPIPSSNPIINITPPSLNFSTFYNTTSPSDSFYVSGAFLTSNITINAPNYFEISNSLTGTYGNSLMLTPTSGNISNAVIYVRFHPTTYLTVLDTIKLTATNATTNYVTVFGTTPAPGIYVSPATIINPFGCYVNLYSPIDSFSVTGNALVGNITIDAPNYFEVSTSSTSGFASSITLNQTSGIIQATNIYVRFHPLTTCNFIDSIKLSSNGATDKYVVVNGMTLSISTNASNPQPFQLASTNYILNQWDSMSAAGTYPANMMFHTTNTATPILTAMPLSNDWICSYNLTNRPRVRGLSADGFSMINTGSPQYDNCVSGGPVSQNMFMGAVVLAINTMNANTITLKYDAGLVKQSDGTIPRVYNVRLQYRFDTLAIYQDYSPLTEYSSAGKSGGDMQTFQLNLPSIFENKPYVQFRWLYYNDNSVSGAGGTRPEIRLDNISVTTPTAINPINANDNNIIAFPNPVENGGILNFSKPVTGVVYDVFGKKVAQLNAFKQLNISNFSQGIYSILLENQSMIKFIVK